MKKAIVMFATTIFLCAAFFAQSSADSFDKLAAKLFDDFDDKGGAIAVKLFNSDLSMQERRKISKSTQLALSCMENVKIVASVADADYVCAGNIESDGPNYVVSVKLIDNYDGSTVAKARQKVPKNYYAETIASAENEIDAEDVLGAIILGNAIGGVFHALTEPRRHAPPHHSAPAKPKPNPNPVPPPKYRPQRP